MAEIVKLTFTEEHIARFIAACLPVPLDENDEPIMGEGAWAKQQAVKDLNKATLKREKMQKDIAQCKAVVKIKDSDLTVT